MQPALAPVLPYVPPGELADITVTPIGELPEIVVGIPSAPRVGGTRGYPSMVAPRAAPPESQLGTIELPPEPIDIETAPAWLRDLCAIDPLQCGGFLAFPNPYVLTEPLPAPQPARARPGTAPVPFPLPQTQPAPKPSPSPGASPSPFVSPQPSPRPGFQPGPSFLPFVGPTVEPQVETGRPLRTRQRRHKGKLPRTGLLTPARPAMAPLAQPQPFAQAQPEPGNQLKQREKECREDKGQKCRQGYFREKVGQPTEFIQWSARKCPSSSLRRR